MHHRYLDKMCSLKRANDAFFQVATPPLGARTRPKRGRGRERERETFIDNQEVTEGGSHRLWALGHTVQAWAMVHLVLHFKERPKLRVDHRHRHLPARGSVCVESLFQHSQSLSREYPDGEYASPKNRNQGPNVFGSNVEIFARTVHAREYTHAHQRCKHAPARRRRHKLLLNIWGDVHFSNTLKNTDSLPPVILCLFLPPLHERAREQ